jgi:hypothetical protein
MPTCVTQQHPLDTSPDVNVWLENSVSTREPKPSMSAQRAGLVTIAQVFQALMRRSNAELV